MDNTSVANNIPLNTPIDSNVSINNNKLSINSQDLLDQWNSLNYPLKGIMDDATNHILIYLITDHYEDKEVGRYIGKCIDIKALGSFKRY